MNKRFISGLAALALVFSGAGALPAGMFEGFSLTASAEEDANPVYGNVHYKIYRGWDSDKDVYDYFCEITSFVKGAKNVVIPEEIDGRKVIGISAFKYDYENKDKESVESVTIPATVNWISFSNPRLVSDRFSDLKEIKVSSGNTKYFSRDGVLYEHYTAYNEDDEILGKGEKLLFYPAGKRDKTFTFANDVIAAEFEVFLSNPYLENIVLPEDNSLHISDEDSDKYFSYDGVVYKNEGLYEYDEHYNEIRIGETIGYVVCPSGKKKAVIPDGVTALNANHYWAQGDFTNCKSLEEVVIPDSVTSVHFYCFTGTPMMEKQTDSFKYAGNWLIKYDTYNDPTEEITIKPGTRGIASYAFGFDAHSGDAWKSRLKFKLKKVNLPDSLKIIDDGAFSCVVSLEEINIPSGIESIGVEAFAACEKLASPITIPGSVKTVRDGAFGNCTSLTQLTLKNGITTIEGGAFYGCTSLTNIVIPDSVTSIGSGISRSFGAGGSFYGCTGLKSINIPNSVKSIAANSFSKCTSLTSVNIPNSVTDIGDYAFSGCTSLKSITIPKSVTSIGKKAFGYYYDSGKEDYVKVGGFTIKGYKDSAAEKYAKDNGFTFVALDDVKYGDLDGKDGVTDADVALLQQYLADWKVTIDMTAADVNCDGKVDEADIALMQQYLADWKVTLGKK